MLDLKRCVRCNCEVHMEDFDDAEYYEEMLLAEGIAVKPDDRVCEACIEELVADNSTQYKDQQQEQCIRSLNDKISAILSHETPWLKPGACP